MISYSSTNMDLGNRDKYGKTVSWDRYKVYAPTDMQIDHTRSQGNIGKLRTRRN